MDRIIFSPNPSFDYFDLYLVNRSLYSAVRMVNRATYKHDPRELSLDNNSPTDRQCNDNDLDPRLD
jgi:hypothetical protein